MDGPRHAALPDDARIARRQILRILRLVALAVPASSACLRASTRAAAATTQLKSRPGPAATELLPPGEHRLGLADGRDGLLYVPRRREPAHAGSPQAGASRAESPAAGSSQPASPQADGARSESRPDKSDASPKAATKSPLAVILHGAGGNSSRLRFVRDAADELGFAVLAPDSRGATWDVLLGGFGPDVSFIDAALAYAFRHVDVDPSRLAIGGFSDGASYALSLGLPNGDLFTHILAFSPGFVVPGETRGRPSIFVSHGTRDQVLPIDRCSRQIVPALREAGYPLRYREFDGPHTVPLPIAREAFAWLTGA